MKYTEDIYFKEKVLLPIYIHGSSKLQYFKSKLGSIENK